MFDPVTAGVVMAAPSIATGLINYLNSSKANRLAAEERRKLEELVNQLQMPNFSPEQLDPAVFSVVEEYVPEVAAYVAEVAPSLLTGETAGAQEGMALERDYLREMLGQAQTGEDAELAIARNRARRETEQGAAAGRATSDAQMARRGFTPSGPLAYALAAEQASQGAMRGALAGEEAVQDAANRRRQALGEVGRLGGRFTDRADDMEQRNAAIINAFNQRVAESGNKYNQYAADTRNKGSIYNIAAKQDAADKTAQSSYDARKYNLGRGDDNAMNTFNSQLAKLGKQGVVTGMARDDIQSDAATTAAGITALGDAATKGLGAYYQMENLRSPQANPHAQAPMGDFDKQAAQVGFDSVDPYKRNKFRSNRMLPEF